MRGGGIIIRPPQAGRFPSDTAQCGDKSVKKRNGGEMKQLLDPEVCSRSHRHRRVKKKSKSHPSKHYSPPHSTHIQRDKQTRGYRGETVPRTQLPVLYTKQKALNPAPFPTRQKRLHIRRRARRGPFYDPEHCPQVSLKAWVMFTKL